MTAAAVAAAGTPGHRIIFVVGLDLHEEGEQKDREDISLPPEQAALVDAVLAAAASASNPIAAVVVHGGAVALAQLKTAGIPILDAFYPGPFGGEAIAAALFGDYNPGGKLPYTVYDEAFAAAVSMMDMRVAATGRTYRYHRDDSPGGIPLWRFGSGRSYTTFSQAFQPGPPPAALVLSPSTPTYNLVVRVENTGARDGDEVLQAFFVPLSVASPQPPFLPLRALMAFKRVSIPTAAHADVALDIDARLMPLTLSDGTRGPIDGEYMIVISRGQFNELTFNVSLSGWGAQ